MDETDETLAKHGMSEVHLDEPPQEPPPKPRLDAIDVGEDDKPIPPRQWLLGNVFCRQFVSGLIGAGASGKTSLRIGQGLELASRKPITGEQIFVRCRVLIVCLEDGMDELRRRVRAAMKHRKIKREDVKGYLFLSTPKRMKLAQYGQKGVVVAGELDTAIRSFIDEKKIDLVILDPIRRTHSVRENESDDMDAVIAIMSELAIEKNIGVDVLSHERKGGSKEAGDAERGRGSGSMKDGSRLIYTLTGMTKQEAKALGVKDERQRKLLFRVDNAKVNLAPPDASTKWFRLVGVNLENGDDTYPNGDEVQTVERWTPPALFGAFSTEQVNQILERLRAGMGDGRRYSVAPSAKERAAWRVIQEISTGHDEAQCRAMIKQWKENGLLISGEYYDGKERKKIHGILASKTIGEVAL